MNNVTEDYWNITQLLPTENRSTFSTTDNVYVNEECCDEPSFLILLLRLENDRLGLLAFLFLFSFATVFGNSLVILAVIRERYLHSKFDLFLCFFLLPFFTSKPNTNMGWESNILLSSLLPDARLLCPVIFERNPKDSKH